MAFCDMPALAGAEGAHEGYVNWLRSAFVQNDFEFWQEVYPDVMPHSNSILSLVASGDGVWAGTTNGLTRLDRASGRVTRVL